MILPDVNVLVYAFDDQSVRHEDCRKWLRKVMEGEEPFAMVELILCSFMRVVTHPKILKKPPSLKQATHAVQAILGHPLCRIVRPGEKHFDIFLEKCHTVKVQGGFISDVYLAAIAIEHDCEMITFDKGFQRIPNLKWRLPY